MRWIFWPLEIIIDLVTSIIKLTGRLIAAVIGLVLLILGIIICMTVVGAIIGVPLVIFGFLLIVRGLF
jgi:hypothetical protein